VRADALLIWLAESKERKKGVDNDLQGLSEPTPSVRPSYHVAPIGHHWSSVRTLLRISSSVLELSWTTTAF
jgi:hypothetical protein